MSEARNVERTERRHETPELVVTGQELWWVAALTISGDWPQAQQ